MCTNYRPTARDLVHEQLDLSPPGFAYPEEVYPQALAPLLVAPRAQQPPRPTEGEDLAPTSPWAEWREAMFGLVPFWSDDLKIARHTCNARTETVAEKPSYRGPWRQRRFGLVPMQRFYEPDYATGRAVRWRIERRDGAPFTVAAIWDVWAGPAVDGPPRRLHSFSLLTINADGHPVMGRFQKPGDERRSLVVVPSDSRAAWLRADAEAARALLVPMPPDEFTSAPDPRPPRGAGRSPAGAVAAG